MLTGNPPHTGASAQQIIRKIVTDEPRPVTALRKSVPPNVAAATAQALEKLPADRFATARAFAEALGNPAFTTIRAAHAASAPTVGAWVRSPWSWGAMATAAVAVVFAATGRRGGRGNSEVIFTQKTFGPEAIFTARFAPDDQTILFSSSGDVGTVPRLFVIRPDYPEAQPLGPDSTHLLAVSSTGQLAVLTGARYIEHRLFEGTLATLPVGGGAPREVLSAVREADWSPDGASLAVIRAVNGIDRLEYPIGTVVYQAGGGYLSDVRISPSGDAVAFFEHPAAWDDRGEVVILDRAGRLIARSPTHWSVEGLAWRRDGHQVLYAGVAATTGSFSMLTIRTMDRKGRTGVALSSAGGLTLQDVGRGGSLLVTRDDQRYLIPARYPPGADERELGWLGTSTNPVLSGDGKVLAFADQGLTGGLQYTVMLRKTDGAPAARLGEGDPVALSADGRWVLAVVLTTPPRLMLYPTGAGEPRRLDHGEFESLLFTSGALFDDGRRFLTCGSLPRQGTRCFVGALAGGPLTPVTPEGTQQAVVSPDGERVAAQVGDTFHLFLVAGGTPRPALGLSADDELSRWSPDGREIWVFQSGTDAIRVDRVDPVTGRRARLSQVAPRERTGVRRALSVQLADDPRVYAYLQLRYSSSLFRVDGVQ